MMGEGEHLLRNPIKSHKFPLIIEGFCYFEMLIILKDFSEKIKKIQTNS